MLGETGATYNKVRLFERADSLHKGISLKLQLHQVHFKFTQSMLTVNSRFSDMRTMDKMTSKLLLFASLLNTCTVNCTLNWITSRGNPIQDFNSHLK